MVWWFGGLMGAQGLEVFIIRMISSSISVVFIVIVTVRVIRSIAGIGRGIGDNIKWHKECLA